MAAGLLYFPGAMPSFDREGRAVTAKLYFYLDQTVTPQTVYSDPGLTTPLSFPVSTDDTGRFPAVYADSANTFTAVWLTADGQTATLAGMVPSTVLASGWSPAFAMVSDGARRVLQVASWTGGSGAPPASGGYVGATGLTNTLASAIDIRGIAGTNGTNGTNGVDGVLGWTPILAIVNDSARRVLQVSDWTGGTGSKPTTGQYVGATGLTSTLASAIDMRGPAGAGTGNVSGSGSVVSGNVAVWSGTSAQVINDTGITIAPQAVGFTAAAGTSARTLTVDANASISAILASITATGWLLGSASKTANYTVATGDRNHIIQATGSNSWTLTLPAAATFGAGAFRWANNGTGNISVARSSSDTVDGLTSYNSPPGEARDYFSDGVSVWTSTVVRSFYAILTSSATQGVGPGYATIDGLLWDGGASGVSGTGSSTGPSGGGACVPFSIPAAAYGTSQSITIGAATPATGSTPVPGSASSIGSLVSSSTRPGSSGGRCAPVATGTYDGGTAGAFYGGAGAASSTGGAVAANPSIFGGASGNSVAAGTAGDGVAPGGAGGNSFNGTGGTGARGECRIWGRPL